MSGFSVYLMKYYSKYYKGNFFLNYALQGVSDSFSIYYVSLISKLFQKKNSLLNSLRLLVIATILLTGVHILITISGLFSDQN
jgi:hypothetical protein